MKINQSPRTSIYKRGRGCSWIGKAKVFYLLFPLPLKNKR